MYCKTTYFKAMSDRPTVNTSAASDSCQLVECVICMRRYLNAGKRAQLRDSIVCSDPNCACDLGHCSLLNQPQRPQNPTYLRVAPPQPVNDTRVLCNGGQRPLELDCTLKYEHIMRQEFYGDTFNLNVSFNGTYLFLLQYSSSQ